MSGNCWFIWIAASARGTIIKIDTATGAILGEYLSAPNGRGRNPSRTTVDANGNVWAGNRDEAAGGQGSVVHVAMEENNQCVDRNGNGMIDTSTGLGDIKPWLNPGGVDDGGGVSSAEDECIIHYVRVSGDNTRHVSVDANNNVWTAGNFGADNSFDLVSPTGAILASTGDLPCGGYGGLVDANGVLWSANRGPGALSLLRYDTNNTITTADDTFACLSAPNSYGLAVDSLGNIWHSQWQSNFIRKYDPAGTILGDFGTGGSCSRGVAVTADDNVWVANSCSNTVTRLSNAGGLLATIAVGNHPTGVSVDAAGKVWATNLVSSDASRIDPATNMVDLTVNLGAGAGPYNYSDMTGSTVIAAPTQGTWTIVHDTLFPGAEWGTVSWNSLEPGDSSITVQVSSSEDGVIFGPAETATNGGDLSVADGRYLKAVVTFTRASTGESPILYDITFDPITAALDHFKCYEAKGKDVKRTVRLEDQFGVEPQVKVGKPEIFCNPVSKNREEIFDDTAHLTCYQIKDRDDHKKRHGRVNNQKRLVRVNNQFGEQILTVDEPENLCVPSEKNGVSSALNLDHFKCYEAKGAPVHVTVDLVDQFGEQLGVKVGKPKRFCNPVSKNEERIFDPTAHLTCYQIKDRDDDQKRLVRVNNQFGEQTLKVDEPEHLCVPSEKIEN